ncbi:MAG: ParB N-terminal domain-containing protein [Prevotella sp.]|jgi:ParB-like chromosome segregation protein Spo0J|nr:ParB N-terminal domain-containing protein [Prevotella sp.]
MKENINLPDEIIRALTGELCDRIKEIPDTDSRIDTLNYIRMMLHQVSPLKHHPVDFVAWERSVIIEANDYNPNSVAPPEMRLLVTSIEDDGYTMPVVTCPEECIFRIVDGFHRRQAEKKSKNISISTYGRLPVTFIRESRRGLDDRMASTVRHNRARGAHNIDLMSNIVRELIFMGRSLQWISRHVGMDMDEILRLKQLTGLAALFAGKEFSYSENMDSFKSP